MYITSKQTFSTYTIVVILIADVFYRMGFLDRDVVVLSGVHWVWTEALQYSEESMGMVHASLSRVGDGMQVTQETR